MNRDRLEGNWKQFSGRAKQQWGALTNDSLAVAAGTRDRLLGRILEQRGLARQAADQQLEDFMNRNRRWWDLTSR